MKKYISIFVLFFIMFSISSAVGSQSNIASAVNEDLQLIPVFPQSQLNNNDSYIDFNMKNHSSEKISVKIKNNSSVVKHVLIKPVNATSTATGIVYQNGNSDRVQEKAKLTNIATVNTSSITIGPKTTKTIYALIKTDNHSGHILGGLQVSEIRDHKSNNKKPSESTAIRLETTKTLPVHIRISNPNKKGVTFQNAFFEGSANGAFVVVNMKNEKNAIMNDIALTYDLINKDKEEKVFSGKVEEFQMAPQSAFPLYIKWNSSKLEPGSYVLHVKAEGQKRQLINFEIKNNEIAEYGKKADLTPSISIVIPLWTFICVGTLIFILVFLFLKRKKKREEKR
ncbi:WxL protein host-binding domain-containing protein [Bacillus pumilus]|uniref:WxL protein host-binding domain-containing protein n=1 Tax=Bacillus pumilus TaxID=1408 RepID=UPI003D7463A2